MSELRVLDAIKRPMQRLGYLKRLVKRVTTLNTSNLDNLGADLIETVSRKVRVPLDETRVSYIKTRLLDRIYKTLKNQADAWTKNGLSEPLFAQMELQDLYLSDVALPSQVGKLVQRDWRKYPVLGTILGFVRAGTYSANTRALTLMLLTSESELKAFLEYKPEHNPLRITPEQALLFLYSFFASDGEVVAPLMAQLLEQHTNGFSDREAGSYLPEIYRSITTRHRKGSIPVEERKRLEVLDKSSESIAKAVAATVYAGGSAREEASRPRLEPYVDMGLLTKPDPARYEQYEFSAAGRVWAEALTGVLTSEDLTEFLAQRFFTVAARAAGVEARVLTTPAEIVPYLHSAWLAIQSPGGYAPIEELALLGGIRALLNDQCVFNHAPAQKALIDYQKQKPYDVRFTVNRLGVLAHTCFIEAPAPTPAQ